MKWIIPEIDIEEISCGDMPGDKIEIDSSHIKRAAEIFPRLLCMVKSGSMDRIVVSVYGGSGVGKSEIGSLLGHFFKLEGMISYVLSGDNYPRRIPEENDRVREEIFNREGKIGLEKYLGTEEEIDFRLVNGILKDFKDGKNEIRLKRMGRTQEELWYETVDFSRIKILILEWTHGNNPALKGVDYPVFLFSTPEETLAHRLARGRDRDADSPFTKIVLEIEQERLNSRADSAALIAAKDGEIISFETFLERIKP